MGLTMIIGNSISSALVQTDPSYANTSITPQVLSQFTLAMKPTYDGAAIKAVNAMKGEYGTGVTTLVRIYNATGEDLDYVTNHDWHGSIWKYPYDQRIANGQWSVFLHAHTYGGNYGTCAALIVRAAAASQDVFLGWQSPQYATNGVYVETRQQDYWPGIGSWSAMQELLDNATNNASLDSSSTWGQLVVTAHGGGAYSPIVDVVLARAGVSVAAV